MTIPSRKSCVSSSRVALLILVLCYVASAAGNEVDLTFNAAPSKDLTTSNNGNLAVQPDGKIIIFGDFQIVNGVAKDRMARLNPDGSLDSSFSFNASAVGFGYISSVVVQPDGKILVGGSNGNGVAKLFRLNSNGSVDGSFTNPYNLGGPAYSYSIRVWAVQPDGKIYVAVSVGGFHLASTTLARLNADGSIDNTFSSLGFDGWNSRQYLNDLVLLPGGKLFIAGSHAFGYVFRINADGSKDSSFESPVLSYSNPFIFPTASSVAVQSDGRVLFCGTFDSVNGIARMGLSRLSAGGSVDLQFPQTNYNGRVRVLSSGKLLLADGFGIVRLDSNGALDNTFSTSGVGTIVSWLLDGLENILLFGDLTEGSVTTRRFTRLRTDGSMDASFNPTVKLPGTVSLAASQTDGKVIVSGDFTQLNGVARSSFGRVNADGTIDGTFNVGTGFDSSPTVLVVQADSKILASGSFSTFNGIPQANIARLNSDGSLDSAFNPGASGPVYSIAVQADNKILVGGSFVTINSANQRALARVNPNGTLDATFAPIFGNSSITAVAIQSDNRIIIGGTFTGVSGFARTNMARLNPDGTVDTSFNAGSIVPINQIVIQPDGKILVKSLGTLRRLNSDGSADNSFQMPALSDSGQIHSILLQADGSVLMGGRFTTVNSISRTNLARLSSAGSMDLSFLPYGANGEVASLVSQPTGKVIVGGSFTLVDSIARVGLARLSTVAFHRAVLFDYDGDGKADVSVYRPSNNYWYLSRSSDSQFTYQYFGATDDIAAPADYDGDGKTDLGVFRPSTGDWWYQSSITGVFTGVHWGSNGDIPRPSDIDADGRADYVVFHPANNTWYRLSSGNGQTTTRYFGAAGDKPVVGDFDGDGKSDPAIFRPSTGVFWYMSSIDSVHRAIPWGSGTDIPAPADYDGDGKTDAAVYRPSTGFWYIYFSGTNAYSFTNFGISEDRPVPADYDGDGKADIAVYRPSTGTWYMLRSTAGFTAQQFGNSTDIPTPNAFVP